MSRKLQQQPNVYQDEITVEMNLIKNKYKVSFKKKKFLELAVSKSNIQYLIR